MGIRNQLSLYFIVLSAVTVLSAGFFVLSSVIDDKKNYINELNSFLGPQIAESLDQKISSLKTELLSLFTLNAKQSTETIFLNQLTKIKTQFPEVKAIYFGVGKNKLKTVSLVATAEEIELVTAISEQLKQTLDLPVINGQFSHLFDSVYAITDKNLFVAVVLNAEFFKSAFQLARGRPSVLINKKNNTIFELNTTVQQNELNKKIPIDVWRNSDLLSMQIDFKDQTNYLLNFARPKNLSNTLVAVVAPAPSARELLKPIIKPSIGIFVGLILLSMLAAYLISQKMATPIEELAAWANQIGQGEWSTPKLQNTGPEISMLSKSFQNMMENLKAREADLKLAQHKIIHAESLAAVGRMSAGIAHEVKNPLGSVLGYAQLINIKIEAQKKKGNVAEVIPIIENYIQLMMDDTRRASKIISDLLTFARQKEIERKPVRVFEFIQAISAKLTSFCENANTKIVIHQLSPDAAAQFEIDSEQLYQVVFNLTQNAVHAVKNHPEAERKIEISAKALQTTITIEVKDNGSGIAPENIKKIFEPFFSTKQVGEGSGLGLAICHGIILQHGGSIDVDSVVNQYTCFKINIPNSYLKS